MKKNTKRSAERDTMRREYDFRGGVRGKYVARYREGTNVVVLDPDVRGGVPPDGTGPRMRDNDFRRLVASIRQAGAIRRGERQPSRVFNVRRVDVQAIRDAASAVRRSRGRGVSRGLDR